MPGYNTHYNDERYIPFLRYGSIYHVWTYSREAGKVLNNLFVFEK